MGSGEEIVPLGTVTVRALNTRATLSARPRVQQQREYPTRVQKVGSVLVGGMAKVPKAALVFLCRPLYIVS